MATQTGSYDFKAAKAVQDNLDNMVIGGTNLILNSAGVLGDHLTTGNEYIAINVGKSYMNVQHGTQVTVSFDLKMTVNTANPTLLVYNTNNKGPKAFSNSATGTGGVSGVSVSFTAAANTTLERRVSVTGYINDRTSPSLTDNYLEFYSTYNTGNVFSISNLKLELGNKATDWSPAPEDMIQPYVIGTQTAATRFWTGNCPELSSLRDGQQITYWLPYAYKGETAQSKGITADELVPAETITTSYNNDWLKLTLADGSDSGWIPIYYGGTSRLTSHYGAANAIHLTYREGYSSAIPKGWWCDANYNTDDVYTRFSDTVIAGLNGVKRYSLNMKDANGNWTSIMNQDNNTAKTGKTAYTGGLMLGNVLYHNSGSNIAAGGNTGQMKESQGAMDFRYSVNGIENASTTELQLRKPIYLVGSVHDDGLFYLNTTKWWTQTPNVEGTVYVQLGTAYSSYYAIFLSVNNPTYIYTGGELVEWEKWMSDEAAKVAGNYIVSTAANDVWIHTEDHGPNSSGAATTNTYGWRIGSVFELVRAGLSYLKMWVDGTVAKVRVGVESAGHSIFSPDGMEVFTNASTSVAKFGSTARVGAENSNHIEIDNDSVDFKNSSNNAIVSIENTTVNSTTFGLVRFMPENKVRGEEAYIQGHASSTSSSVLIGVTDSTRYAELTLSSQSDGASMLFAYASKIRLIGDVTFKDDGPLPIASGGTGLTASPSMLTNLGSTSAANVLQASPRPGITGTLGIAHGGTGMTGTTSASSGVVTAASGTTIVSQSYAKWGKVCQVYVSFKRTSAVHVPASGNITNVLVFTLNDGYRPKIYSGGWSNGDGAGATWYTVGTDGKVNIGAMEAKSAAWNTSTDDLFSFFSTFILP